MELKYIFVNKNIKFSLSIATVSFCIPIYCCKSVILHHLTISFHFRWLASLGIIGGYFRNRCFGNGGSESENDEFVRIVAHSFPGSMHIVFHLQFNLPSSSFLLLCQFLSQPDCTFAAELIITLYS